jgi:hypothetical protein
LTKMPTKQALAKLDLPPSALADPGVLAVIDQFAGLEKRQRAFLERMLRGDQSVSEILAEIGTTGHKFQLWFTDPAFRRVYTATAEAISELYAVPAQKKRQWLVQAIEGSLALDSPAGYRAATEAVKVLMELDDPDGAGLLPFQGGFASSLKAGRHLHRVRSGSGPAIQINIGALRGDDDAIEAERA